MLEVGTDAPEFELPDANGNTIALSDFEGQRVVVYFYPRANTSGCTRQAKGFRDRYEAFRDRGIEVIGISDDPVEDLQAFAEDYDLPFHLLSDEPGAVGRAYDSYGERMIGDETVASALRNTYVIDPEGRIEAAYEGVTPDGHAGELLEELGTPT